MADRKSARRIRIAAGVTLASAGLFTVYWVFANSFEISSISLGFMFILAGAGLGIIAFLWGFVLVLLPPTNPYEVPTEDHGKLKNAGSEAELDRIKADIKPNFTAGFPPLGRLK